MKGVYLREYGALENARIEDIPEPVPREGEVVVEVKAAEANFPDLLVIEGKYQIKPTMPFSPGKGAAGIVETVGAGVTAVKPGDRVAVEVEFGAFAQKVKALAEHCYPMPADMPFDQATALGVVYQTAWFALTDRAGFSPGETVLVLGASGGVGVASIQMAKAMGARTVIACTTGTGEAIARQAGADHVIDRNMANLRDGLRDAVAGITHGHGADIIIDPVGGDVHTAALRALAWRGRLVIIGFTSGTIPVIKSNYLLLKNIAVTGLNWSEYRDLEPELVADAQAKIFDLWSAGKVVPIISQHLPLEEFANALTLLRDGKAQGKIILEP